MAFIFSKYSANFTDVLDSEIMRQKYKIFLRRHQFVFDENSGAEVDAHLTIQVLNKELIKILLDYLKEEKLPQVIWVKARDGFVHFCSYLKLIRAGGGVVFNTEGELLLIRRNGLWDLPKGKLEKEEDSETGAVREVEEECNVSEIDVQKQLTTSYHIYRDKKWLLKRTDWYIMKSNDWQSAKPQLEENIVDIKWVSPESLNLEHIEMYSSIKDVLRQYL